MSSTASAAITKSRQAAEEFRSVAALAAVRGGTPAPHVGEWPDGWIREPDGTLVPVEVVAAFQRRPGEDPRGGAGWMRAQKDASRRAQLLADETGFVVVSGAHYDRPYVVPCDGKHDIPPPVTHPELIDQWIETAIRQKIAKNYSVPSLLVVDLDGPWMPRASELARLGGRIPEARGRFIEIWVTNIYSDPPKRVPL